MVGTVNIPSLKNDKKRERSLSKDHKNLIEIKPRIFLLFRIVSCCVCIFLYHKNIFQYIISIRKTV